MSPLCVRLGIAVSVALTVLGCGVSDTPQSALTAKCDANATANEAQTACVCADGFEGDGVSACSKIVRAFRWDSSRLGYHAWLAGADSDFTELPSGLRLWRRQ